MVVEMEANNQLPLYRYIPAEEKVESDTKFPLCSWLWHAFIWHENVYTVTEENN